MIPIVLASASAARQALLAAAGVEAEAHPVRVDEAAIKQALQAEGASPSEAATVLADTKAARIRRPGVLVIGADQLLECEGTWFDKPADPRAQLLALRGKTHTLHTAVTCWRDGASVWHHVARPRLTMRAFSDAFLDRYLAAEGDALLGCVGAYRLEGLGVQLFSAVDGEHSAVLGLPLLPLLGFLRQHGALLA